MVYSPLNYQEMETEAEKALRDFLFAFGYSIGVIWVIQRIKWLKLKPHFQTRLNAKLKGE